MKKIISLAFICFVIFGFATLAFNVVSNTDPLIPLSYIDDTVYPKLTNNILSKAGDIISMEINRYNKLLNGLDIQLEDVLNIKPKIYNKNDLITTQGEFIIKSGTAQVDKKVLDLTKGIETSGDLKANVKYLATEPTVVKVTSNTANIDIVSTSVSTYNPRYTKYADALKELNLFKGTNNGYELARTSNRAEGLTMLIRFLGEEQTALKDTSKIPFIDVLDWNTPYVRYAYNKKYTNGISSTKFGSTLELKTNEYITFMLRALGYDDSSGDFKFDMALDKALDIKLIDKNYYDDLKDRDILYRDDMVYLSFNALKVKLKESDETLAQSLINKNVFTKAKYDDILKNFS